MYTMHRIRTKKFVVQHFIIDLAFSPFNSSLRVFKFFLIYRTKNRRNIHLKNYKQLSAILAHI